MRRLLADKLRGVLRSLGTDLVRVSPDLAASESMLAAYSARQHLTHLFARHRFDAVVDVGANQGQFAQLVRRCGFRGRILSFEPVPQTAERLESIAAFDRDWSVYRIALGQTATEGTMHVTSHSEWSSLRQPGDTHKQYFEEATQVVEQLQVPIQRLDQTIEEIAPAAADMFVKIDTQGTDWDVLLGASGCLDRIAGLTIEMPLKEMYADSDGIDYQARLRELEDMGFVVTGFFPVARSPDSLALYEMDCVMVRGERAAG